MVAGGKYTTYRLMARDAVDAVAHGLDGRVAPSCTETIPLVGADGHVALWNARYTLARSSGLHVAGSSTCCTGTARWPGRSST